MQGFDHALQIFTQFGMPGDYVCLPMRLIQDGVQAIHGADNHIVDFRL